MILSSARIRAWIVYAALPLTLIQDCYPESARDCSEHERARGNLCAGFARPPSSPGEGALGALTGGAQAPHGALATLQILLVLALEFFDEVVHKPLVEVFAP